MHFHTTPAMDSGGACKFYFITVQFTIVLRYLSLSSTIIHVEPCTNRVIFFFTGNY